MRLISTYRWSCLLDSFCMVLNIDPKIAIDFLGHDGSDRVWPNHIEPYCRRGFHIQEMIMLALQYNHTVTEIQTVSCCAPTLIAEPLYSRVMDFDRVLENSIGVLYRPGHAAAWNREKVFDPKGIIFDTYKAWKPTIFYMISGSEYGRDFRIRSERAVSDLA